MPGQAQEEAGAPPKKIRRGNKEELPTFKNYRDLRGLSPREFLPLNNNNNNGASRAVPDPLWFLKPHKSFPVQDLLDDIVGTCFFSGFLDSIEIIRLSRVSKRFRSIASQQVQHLDLRGCTKLDKNRIQNMVSRFPNLTVSENFLSHDVEKVLSDVKKFLSNGVPDPIRYSLYTSMPSLFLSLYFSFSFQSLDFSYCPQFGREELFCLVPLSRTLKNLRLKGTNVEDDGFVAFLEEVVVANNTNSATTTRIQGSSSSRSHGSLLESIDLSAISKDGSLRVGNKSVDAISVRGLPACLTD
jgi:hypothetical protein